MKKFSLIAGAIVFLFIANCSGPEEESKPAPPAKAGAEEHVSGNISASQQDPEAATPSQGEHVSGSLSAVPTPHISGQ